MKHNILLAALLAAAVALPAAAQTQNAQQSPSGDPTAGAAAGLGAIKITSARYGDPNNAQRTCDATQRLESMCDGKSACDIPINFVVMCGPEDPAPSVVKAFQIDYRCGEATRKRITGQQGNLAKLSCAR